MLYIITERDEEEYRWHVGDESDVQALAPKVVEIQADGHELDYILENFENIRKMKYASVVVRWFGDEAKFIVSNL